MHAGIQTPWAGTPPGQTPPEHDPLPSACWDTHPLDTPPGQTPPRKTSCPVHAGIHTPPCPVHAGIDVATAADGMHPTGMHSCYENVN